MAQDEFKDKLQQAYNGEMGTKGQGISEVLDEAFGRSITTVTPQIVNNCYQHLPLYIEKAKNREDI